MNIQEKNELSKKTLQVIRSLQTDSETWIPFTSISNPLVAAGINYKQCGFLKLGHFLNEFQDILEFKNEYPTENCPPVYYVRPKLCDDNTKPVLLENKKEIQKSEKFPTEYSWLFNWAFIPNAKIQKLSELALNERWYYGEAPAQDEEQFPILRNYLAYTFKRLCFEKKILIKTDVSRDEEYAAFNTGLVDKKYEYIHALFVKNTRPGATNYWYLLDFVVPGEDLGKTLVKVFNPKPERADYFENKIQNMLYDTTTGELSCDYSHIIIERTERLPTEFLKENCKDITNEKDKENGAEDFLCIDGVGIDEVCNKPTNDADRKAYYVLLGKKIGNNKKILNRLKYRIEDAVDLALKRVEWNYKTAIPMYFPTKNACSLLLPLALVDEDRVDLALVVERLPSGAYQGQTILPLYLAYSDSRLVTRPDSDWLKTDIINFSVSNDEIDNDRENDE